MSKKIFNKEMIAKLSDAKNMNKYIYRSDNIWYRNMDNTRNKNILYHCDNEEMMEYYKCSTNIFYFIENYALRNGENIILRDYQKEMIENFFLNKFNIYHMSRELGSSLVFSLIYLWIALFQKEKNIIIVSHKLDNGVEMIDIIKSLYQGVPFFLQAGITKWENRSIEFDNHSLIKILPYSKNMAIGYNINHLHMIDFAHISKNVIEPLYRTLIPTLAALKDTTLVIQSTANGENLFKELCDKAMMRDDHPLSNNYTYHKYPWWNITTRDEAWVNDKIKTLGSEKLFRQEYNCEFV